MILDRYVKGKSISIVANGSAIMGIGKGEDVDSRDFVIRLTLQRKVAQEDEKYIGSRTDLVYCGWCVWDNDVLNIKHDPNYWMNEWNDQMAVEKTLLGYPAIPKSKEVEYLLGEKYKHLKKDASMWSPTTGTICFYDACVSGAKEIFLSGYDFLRSYDFIANKKHDRHSKDGKSNSHHDLDIDEQVLKDLISEGYPIKMDKVMEDIILHDKGKLYE